MWNESEANAAARERISALLDGELERSAVVQACGHWRENGESRAAWHAYHLIGDVLRSDDLASHPDRDASFLVALRAKLANEPVVLAPEPAAHETVETEPARVAAAGGGNHRRSAGAAIQRRRAWLTPATVAAGFVAVAGVLTLTRPGFAPDRLSAGPLALNSPTSIVTTPAPTAVTPVSSTTTPVAAPEMPTFVANGQLIRDARLDRYLAAHQQFAGSSALGAPSAYLRNATAELPGR